MKKKIKPNKTSSIRVAKKSDKPVATKQKVGIDMNGKKKVVPNLAALRKRGIITSLD